MATPRNSKLLHYYEYVHSVWCPRSLQRSWRRLRSFGVWRRVCGPTYNKPHDVTAIPSKLFGDGLTILTLRWLYIVHKDSVCTSQRTQCTSIGETKLVNTVEQQHHCLLPDSCGTHKQTLWGERRVLSVKSDSIYIYQYDLKGHVPVFQLKTENLHSVLERCNTVSISYYGGKKLWTQPVQRYEYKGGTYPHTVFTSTHDPQWVGVGVTQCAGASWV